MPNLFKAKAHTNIALIKYWGKADDELILPLNSSLSLTLNAFYTETWVSFEKDVEADTFYLDGEAVDIEKDTKVQTVLRLVREATGEDRPVWINSKNQVPTAAGLASSASGLAALAGALSAAAGLRLSSRDLSRLARRGSGSASRSIYGGLVEWQAGTSDETSYAVPLTQEEPDLAMIFILINRDKKKISSRQGMKITVTTSPYIEAWVQAAKADILDMKQAIKNRDFQALGQATERSASRMHATTLGADPPFSYLEPDSLRAIHLLQDMRAEGYPVYFTMDAGPNVKVLCQKDQAPAVLDRLSQDFNPKDLVYSGVGPGLSIEKNGVEIYGSGTW